MYFIPPFFFIFTLLVMSSLAADPALYIHEGTDAWSCDNRQVKMRINRCFIHFYIDLSIG